MKEWFRQSYWFRFAICLLTAAILIAANAGGAYCAGKIKKQDPALSLRLDDNGKTEIYMMLTFEPPPLEQIQAALGEALGCRIQNAKLEKFDMGSRYGVEGYDEEQEEEQAADEATEAAETSAASRNSDRQSSADEQRPELLLWNFTATSEDAFPKQNFLVAGEIKLEPIINLLRSSGAGSLIVTFEHPRYGYSQCTQGEGLLAAEEYGFHFYRVPFDSPAFQAINISFGYKASDLVFPLALSLSFLLLPIALSLFLRRAALRTEGEKRYAAWLRLWKTTSWMTIVAWVGWSFIFSFPLMREMLRLFSFDGNSGFHAGLNIAVYLIPPTLVIGLCYALMLSVYMRMRGINHTRRDLVQQVLVEQVGSILIMVLFSMGIGAVFFAPRQGVLLLASAFVAAAIIGSLKKRFLNLAPYALEVGQLRDRIFEMAGRCGVKLKQVYILPEDKMKTINAMASSSDHLILTNELLASLNKREVDSVVAHELGHLKHRHPKSIGMIFVVGIVLINIGSGTLASLLNFDYGFTVCVLLFLLALNYCSRKFEYTADIHSAYLMGDPRPLISALAKMSRLMMLPMASDRASEMVSTHPYTQNRVEALARFGNVSSEELQRLVSEPDLNREQYNFAPIAEPDPLEERYNLASIAESNDRVFSTGAKQKISHRIGWTLIAAKTLIPALFAFVALELGLTDPSRLMIYLAGFTLTTAIYFWLLNLVPVTGCKAMIMKLREKFDREAVGPKHQQGMWVGFSPDAEIRYYESNDDWDLGYLFIAGNRLCYVGEQTRFCLLADQIEEIRTASSSASWWKSERVFISWLDRERNTIKTFNLHACEANSLTDGSRKTRALAQSLREWKDDSNEDADMPAGLAQPEIGEVTSRSLSEVTSPGKMANLAFVMLFIAAAVCLALQLPFSPQRGGGALYVMAVTLIVTLLEAIPSLKRHKKESRQPAKQQALAGAEATE